MSDRLTDIEGVMNPVKMFYASPVGLSGRLERV